MFVRTFDVFFDWVGRHLRFVLIALSVLLIFSAFAISKIKFSNNIEVMLPQDKELSGQLNFLQESSFSGKVVVSLELTDSEKGLDFLLASADGLSRSFTGPLVTRAVQGFSGYDISSKVNDYLNSLPQLVTSDVLKQLQAKLDEEYVKAQVKKIWAQSMRAEGMFFTPINRIDPFGLALPALAKAQKLSTASGYQFTLQNGHLVSKDLRHVMLVLDTPVKATEGARAKALLDHIKDKLSILPEGIKATVICAHRHTVGNEAAVKGDIARTSLIAALAFLLVLFIAYKDLRAVIFFLIPLCAVVVATSFTGLFFGTLSYFVVAMGAVIVGIADDYGIHVYTALHARGRKDIVKSLFWPLFVALMVTICVFSGFFFSSIRGYHMFAFFAIVSIVLCFIFVLLILPHIIDIRSAHGIQEENQIKSSIAVPADITVIQIWVLVMIFFAGLGMRADFNNDISNFDGAGQEVLRDENDFNAVWSKSGMPAILAVEGRSLEEALEKSEKINRNLRLSAGADNVVSLGDLWPPQAVRKENITHWREFWNKARCRQMEAWLKKYSRMNGFKDDMFAPFVSLIKKDDMVLTDGPKMVDILRERFVQKKDDAYTVVTYFPDDQSSLRSARDAAFGYNGALIISRSNFSQRLGYVLADEITRMTMVSFVLVMLITFWLLGNIRVTLIALLPMISAVAAVAGGFTLLHEPLNAPALIAMIVVIGLSIDYGVLMLHGLKGGHEDFTQKAMWVSASTTLIGAATLLFAKHPLLFSIGLALSFGLTAGFLTAQFVVGALYRLWLEKTDA